MQGYKRTNEPGGIYIIRAICEAYELATGMMMIKIGLCYKGRKGTLDRAIEHKTSCPHSIDIVRTFAEDDDTPIPTHTNGGSTLGGVHEMERYLHHLMEELGCEHIGDGTEWFAVPLDLLSNKDKCPELQAAINNAPAWSSVTAFERLGHDVNTTNRSKAEKAKDRANKCVTIS